MFKTQLVALFPAVASLPPGAYVVGGAVRDLLLGREPADVDIACPNPLACAELVANGQRSPSGGQRKVIRLGKEDHLSAHRVVLGEHVYDFAEILDGDIGRDLARRDFTVNAMAIDLAHDTLLDPHGGERDVRARIVRMVHDTNFDDDPLRTLKGVRMAVKYAMMLDAATCDAIGERAPKILDVAAERVTYELSVIFSSHAFRKAVDLLHRAGLDVPLFGRALDVHSFHADDVTVAGAFALLIEDPRAYAEHWRWSEHLLRDVLALQKLLDRVHRGDSQPPELSPQGESPRIPSMRVELFHVGEHAARQLPSVLRALARDASLRFPDFSTRPLLRGEEIADLAGLAPGRALGRVVRALLEAQIDGRVHTRDDAIAFVQSVQSETT